MVEREISKSEESETQSKVSSKKRTNQAINIGTLKRF
jgi:hypothetical protein